MSDELLTEILKRIGNLHAVVARLDDKMERFDVTVKFLRDDIHVLQQDTREVRSALNDMERTRFTAGELKRSTPTSTA
jgi:hypothetical protein